MTVRVRLFAFAKQIAGEEVAELDLRRGATISELRRELVRRYPDLASLASHLRFSVDAQYVTDEFTLDENADVACIPPVSGG